MLLTADEHCIGRMVEDKHFKIDSNAVSARHCKIYREKVIAEDSDRSNTCCSTVFIKDTRFATLCVPVNRVSWDSDCICTCCSTNGTYVNWERLWKNGQEVKIQHGDIISLSAAPQSGSNSCSQPLSYDILESHKLLIDHYFDAVEVPLELRPRRLSIYGK